MAHLACMLFMSDRPLIGIDPHPAYAPQEAPKRYNAKGWAECYGATFESASQAQHEALEDHKAALAAVENGDLEDVGDPDIPYMVIVHDDGRLEVLDEDNGLPIQVASHTPRDIFETFGMTPPMVDAHRVAFDVMYGLIEQQFGSLIDFARETGLAGFQANYFNDDPDPGYEEIIPLDEDGREIPWPTALLVPHPDAIYPNLAGDHAEFFSRKIDLEVGFKEAVRQVFDNLSEAILNCPDPYKQELNTIQTFEVEVAGDGTISTTLSIDGVVPHCHWPEGEPVPSRVATPDPA